MLDTRHDDAFWLGPGAHAARLRPFAPSGLSRKVALKFLARHPDRTISGTIGGMGWFREGSRLQDFWEKIPAREGQRTPAAFLRGIGAFAIPKLELERIAVPVKTLVGHRDPCKVLYVAPLRRVRPDWPGRRD
jgi:hypothetical protein